MAWRDLKTAAKAVVHATFQIPAIYLPAVNLTAVVCKIRLHDKVDPMSMGAMEGNRAVTVLETQPRITFAVAEVPNPLPRAYVFLSALEVYRLGQAEPASTTGYITVDAVRLDAAAAASIVTASDVDLTLLDSV